MKRVNVTIMNHKGFKESFASLGDIRLQVFNDGEFMSYTLESDEDWVHTEKDGTLSAFKIFKEARPRTLDFEQSGKKVESLNTPHLLDVIWENLPDQYRDLVAEMTERYNDMQSKLFECRGHSRYEERDLWNAMQFAVYDVTGRNIRPAFLDVLLDDFLTMKESKEV